ncbi:MAG: VCBS repeat-containing protein [Lentisphaeraceae bacterium]|nr:VCBS repeat-containing protein [Lentisphaeraceae bacterium]
MYRIFFFLLFTVHLQAQEPTSWPLHIIDGKGSGADGVRLADINGDNLPDVVTGWEESGLTKIYLNPGPSKVKDKWPLTVIGNTKSVEDAFFADLDNDGNPDVVTCSEGKTQSISIHWNPGKSKFMEKDSWQQELIPVSKDLTAWMFAQAMQIDGKNGLDIIAGSKKKNAQIGWFQMPENSRSLKDVKYHKIADAGWIMSIEKVDMDKDGLTDILISDRYGDKAGIRWLKNPGPNGDITKAWQDNFIFKFPGSKQRQYLFLSMHDLDNDGQFEIIFPSKKGVHILRKIKDGQQWQEFFIDTSKVNCGGPKAVAVSDINQDGKTDIILTCESSDKKNGIVYFEYNESPFSSNWSWKPLSGTEKGIKYDRIELLDLDGDGDLDLMTCEENEGPKSQGLGVIWYENPLK